MKKLIYIFVALLAFACGLLVYYIRPLIIPISLAELRQNTEQYKSRKFKVTGKLEVVEAESIYFINLKDYENDCSGGPMCFKGLQLSNEVKAENIELIKELAEKNKTFGVTNFISGDYLAEVEVTGELIEEGESQFGGGMIYDIKVEKIKRISPIKFVTAEEMNQR